MDACHCTLAGTNHCLSCSKNINNNITCIGDLTVGHFHAPDCGTRYPYLNHEISPSLKDIMEKINPAPVIKALTLREKFIQDYESKKDNIKYIVLAILLPTGTIKIVTDTVANTDTLHDKFQYYCNVYDDNFVFKSNDMVKIVNYMIV